jgi:hypothetical protein
MTRRSGSISWIAVVLAGLAVAACGEDATSDESMRGLQAWEDARRAQIETLVREGRVPPIARRLLNPNGTMNVNFVDGPGGDNDVVRTSDDGATGRRLAWDLDGDGRIERSERTITERELYDATLVSP